MYRMYRWRWLNSMAISLVIFSIAWFVDILPLQKQLNILTIKKKNLQHATPNHINKPSSVLQNHLDHAVMQSLQSKGLTIISMNTTPQQVFHMELIASYKALFQFVTALPPEVWLQDFHLEVEKEKLRILLRMGFLSAHIALKKSSSSPQHNPFCLARMIVYSN